MRAIKELGLRRNALCRMCTLAVRCRTVPERAAARSRPPGTWRTFHEPRRLPGVDGARLPGNGNSEVVAPVPPCSLPFQGAMSPAPAVPTMPPPGASVPRASATAGTPPEPVHTHQPLVGVYTRPASRRALPRGSQNSRSEPQAHPDTRRTFHQPRGPPETEAERARSVLPSFENSNRL